MRRTFKQMSVLAVAGLLGALTVPGTAAASADLASAAGTCSSPDGVVSAHPDGWQLYMACEQGLAYVQSCPSGLDFNPYGQYCDWPASAGTPPTGAVVQAGPAVLSLLPLQVKGLSAKATYGGATFFGTARFTTAAGDLLCEANTDASGVARCDSAPGLTAPVNSLLQGYQATFTATEPTILPRTGTGTVNAL
ncbi:carbohydrate-binding module family 14 protein [Kitasatospora sp. GP82]|uniref:carbohydrate-binding module family 14 protein n=1 Tax=Kitasatospora sp. GP82 TaxID=3035089 RepID=UPI002473DE76|nr:carbohydrate-binding module family 14 protein [Kitasatospora sp. GP82]MDH6129221.1 hypothetical protein [Kitasatospora sp. GP82]